MDYDFDFIVVGSGFGGSVSACRLTEKGYSVAVMEMGKRWQAEDFPDTNWNFRKWLFRPTFKLHGFFNLNLFRHVMIISGNAVGGGSVTYANTLLEPKSDVWDQGSWAGLADWQNEMPGYFAKAKAMLGVTQNKLLGKADKLLQQMAIKQGAGDSFQPTDVATFFPQEGEAGGKTYDDPYFNGEGPARATCTGCGGCMTGCKFNAKNTLDKNYLYFAEKGGAKIFAETKVVDVVPLNGKTDGGDGYQVTVERSTAWWFKQRRTFTCKQLVFAGSSMGTQELLFRLKQQGSLPHISTRLGDGVRTNAESIVGIRFPGKDVDISGGVAIGSRIYLDEHTHIEATRYAKGNDAMGLLCTLMVSGKPGIRRIGRWLRQIISQPLTFFRMSNPVGFARQSLIFLVMQHLDGTLKMRLRRPWYWPFSKTLVTYGDKIPSYIPQANAFTEKMAREFGGTPMTTLTEILFNIPFTAHCMGGCVMGKDSSEGVIDNQNRLFGYQGLYVIDGAMLSSNLGVNPSLTITALAERAMDFIPEKTHHSPATSVLQSDGQ